MPIPRGPLHEESLHVPEPTPAPEPLLSVRDLKVHFPYFSGPLWNRRRHAVRAVDGVNFDVHAGQTLGLVGESGCGKSTTARAVLNLVPKTAGEVILDGQPIGHLSSGATRGYRQRMQMIFQDPFSSLNPRMTVGQIIAEPMQIFHMGNQRQRELETLRLLDLVGLSPQFFNRYPHEFSGGQRQRVGVARALAVKPDLIFCDEPVSALDVSIQAQVINLLVDLKRRFGLSYVFIAHDLAVVRHIADVVAVMYLGRIVELAPSDELYTQPRHPYTQALLSAVPVPDPVVERTRKRIVLTGEVPSPDKEYQGCPFADRCGWVQDACRQQPVALEGLTHQVACLRAQEVAESWGTGQANGQQPTDSSNAGALASQDSA